MRTFTIPVALMLLPTPAVAQRTQPGGAPAVNGVVACRQIASPEQRLACFDQATQGLTAALEQGEVAVVTREQASRTRRSLFGFAVPDFPFFKGKGDREEIKQIDSTVVTARPFGSGHWRIVIADANALWETSEATSAFREPLPGETVRITRGALGSYWLKVGRQRDVRARRVR